MLTPVLIEEIGDGLAAIFAVIILALLVCFLGYRSNIQGYVLYWQQPRVLAKTDVPSHCCQCIAFRLCCVLTSILILTMTLMMIYLPKEDPFAAEVVAFSSSFWFLHKYLCHICVF